MVVQDASDHLRAGSGVARRRPSLLGDMGLLLCCQQDEDEEPDHEHAPSDLDDVRIEDVAPSCPAPPPEMTATFASFAPGSRRWRPRMICGSPSSPAYSDGYAASSPAVASGTTSSGLFTSAFFAAIWSESWLGCAGRERAV